MPDDSSTAEQDTLPAWCAALVAAITRRTAITYAINEILKTNTKTTFTDGALTWLKNQQAAENLKIKEVLNILTRGHHG